MTPVGLRFRRVRPVTGQFEVPWSPPSAQGHRCPAVAARLVGTSRARRAWMKSMRAWFTDANSPLDAPQAGSPHRWLQWTTACAFLAAFHYPSNGFQVQSGHEDRRVKGGVGGGGGSDDGGGGRRLYTPRQWLSRGRCLRGGVMTSAAAAGQDQGSPCSLQCHAAWCFLSCCSSLRRTHGCRLGNAVGGSPG